MSGKAKKGKQKLTRKEAIRKGNKEFRSFARELVKSMNASEKSKESNSKNKKK